MKEILTKCGYRCDLCLAYSENVKKNDRREELSKGWKDIFDIDLPAQNIVCEGCMSCYNPILIDRNCPVRKCTLKKAIENCGYCSDYPCDKLKTRIVNRQQLENKLQRKITQQEYNNFVKPYESKPRLDKIKNDQNEV